MTNAIDNQPDDVSRRVTLSKAQRATPAGRELIALLTDLSDDGVVTRDEVARLLTWLEVDRGVDFAACGFLYEVVESIASDGDMTEEELDTIAVAIERVLPPDIRKLAAEKRKRLRIAKRDAGVAAREVVRAAAAQERERARPLHRGDFIIAGAMRSSERREACDGLTVAESVLLEREPENRHDKNAILILTHAGGELGYVPREDAKVMAPLMDVGGWADATVKKLLETERGTLPVIVSKLYREGAERPAPPPRVVAPPTTRVAAAPVIPKRRIAPAAPVPVPPARRGYFVLGAVGLALIFLAFVLS